MAGLKDTLGSPWPPLATRPCLRGGSGGFGEVSEFHFTEGDVVQDVADQHEVVWDVEVTDAE
jgi:hypothetical protein